MIPVQYTVELCELGFQTLSPLLVKIAILEILPPFKVRQQ